MPRSHRAADGRTGTGNGKLLIPSSIIRETNSLFIPHQLVDNYTTFHSSSLHSIPWIVVMRLPQTGVIVSYLSYPLKKLLFVTGWGNIFWKIATHWSFSAPLLRSLFFSFPRVFVCNTFLLSVCFCQPTTTKATVDSQAEFERWESSSAVGFRTCWICTCESSYRSRWLKYPFINRSPVRISLSFSKVDGLQGLSSVFLCSPEVESGLDKQLLYRTLTPKLLLIRS